jgi:hypothetical protein
MKTDVEKIMDQIDLFLQTLNNDSKQRSESIKELIDFLSYNLRVTELSDLQKRDFVYCMEGYPLTDKQHDLLTKSNDKEKNYYIDMWARSTYFRRCAWLTYLHGQGEIPSVNSQLSEQEQK